MKICVMTSVYALSDDDRNGSFLVESTKHLVRRGHEVNVFAPSYAGQGDHRVNGVPVHRFRYFFPRWENLTHGQGAPNRIRNRFYLFVAFFYIVAGAISAIRFCRKKRFGLIHVHWPFPHGIWGFLAGRASGTPMVLTFHGAEILLSKKFFFVNYFLRHAIKHARAIICNSSYTAQEVARLTERPIAVIPFGCTVRDRPSIKKEIKERREILFAGRLIARKGLDYLLRAMPLIKKEIDVQLHVVGDGNMADAWKRLACHLGIGESVTFHGTVSNERLESLYEAADIFVLPAIVDDRGDTEGLGVVLIEALSFCTPAVASSVGGIPDIIVHEKTGLLVPQKDPEALANAVVRVLKDTVFAKRLAEEGLRRVRRYFDWDRITNDLIAVYQAASA